MGFCLFEDTAAGGKFLAVNCQYIQDYELLGEKNGQPVTRFTFSKPLVHNGQELKVDVYGTPEGIDPIIDQSTKIGLTKANFHMMNRLGHRPTPLLINQPGRVMLVKELLPEQFMSQTNSVMTVSILYYEDGKTRFIEERPGQFAYHTNQGSNVPILKQEGQ